LAVVAEHYLHFGGVSPINGQNRELLAAIRADFAAAGLDLPVYWGNRNWEPYVTDTLRQMARDGVRRALAFATSAYTSYSGCRQYQDDLAAASGEITAEIGADAPVVDKLRHFFNHPGFIEPAADAVRAALREVPAGARLVFTAHSIPTSMARDSGPDGNLYVTQLTEAARLVTAAVAPGSSFDLVWQSRSGPPQVPWLEPDVNDHLERLAADGVTAVVVAPIGFVSDHMEVRWDLDNEAADTARRLGLGYARAGTPGADPRFVAMIRELVLERLDAGCPRRALGPMGPSHDVCPVGCCPAPARPPASRT
jgi:ferrochelatase